MRGGARHIQTLGGVGDPQRTLLLQELRELQGVVDGLDRVCRLVLHSRKTYPDAAVFSPDGRTLAMSSLDHGVDLWNTATGHLRRSLPLHAAQLISLAFSPDGRSLATGSVDRGVTLWNTDTGRLRRSFPQQATGAVDAMAFSPDRDTLATGGDDHAVRLWDATSAAYARA